MLHHRLLDQELTPHLRCEHPVAAGEGSGEARPTPADPHAATPWALMAAVLGNVLAGGLLLATLLVAPLVLQRMLSLF